MSDARYLWDELLRMVTGAIDDALDRYHPNLTRATGVLPPRHLPPAGGSGGGGGGARGAVRLSDDPPQDVATTPDAGSSGDGSRADHVHALPESGVAAGSYGDATHVGQFTVDTQGRLTSAASVAISGASGSAGGDLAGSYPDPTVAKIQGHAVSSAAPDDADRLRYDATAAQWQPSARIWTPLTDGDERLIFAAGELIYMEMVP